MSLALIFAQFVFILLFSKIAKMYVNLIATAFNTCGTLQPHYTMLTWLAEQVRIKDIVGAFCQCSCAWAMLSGHEALGLYGAE
jgi:hypothetical protein